MLVHILIDLIIVMTEWYTRWIDAVDACLRHRFVGTSFYKCLIIKYNLFSILNMILIIETFSKLFSYVPNDIVYCSIWIREYPKVRVENLNDVGFCVRDAIRTSFGFISSFLILFFSSVILTENKI